MITNDVLVASKAWIRPIHYVYQARRVRTCLGQ